MTKKPSLAETHPELAAQADGWDPMTLTAYSGKKVGWKCEFGHSWKAVVASRSNGNRCPVCSNRLVLGGFNDLTTTHPELAAQAVGWDPRDVIAGSSKKLRWRCENGHEYLTTPNRRTRQKRGCAVCVNQKVLAGYNDLATTHPELAAQAVDWDPTTLTFGSSVKIGWKCELGHLWNTTPARRSSGVNCPICSNKKLFVGFNDLVTTHPEIATQADGWDPTTLTFGSNVKVGWKCELGHSWRATITSRSNGNGCPVCSNNQLLVGFNDLVTTHPEIAAQADGWDPTTIISGSDFKRRWRCENGHTWVTSASHRINGQGCPSCAIYGFKPNQKAWLYLIDNDHLEMFQIGITNNVDERVSRHTSSGWEVVELRGPMDGHLTQKLETDCLHALEKRGAVLGHKAGIKKFDGYSEAWTKQSLNVTSIKQILDWVYEDEAK